MLIKNKNNVYYFREILNESLTMKKKKNDLTLKKIFNY